MITRVLCFLWEKKRDRIGRYIYIIDWWEVASMRWSQSEPTCLNVSWDVSSSRNIEDNQYEIVCSNVWRSWAVSTNMYWIFWVKRYLFMTTIQLIKIKSHNFGTFMPWRDNLPPFLYLEKTIFAFFIDESWLVVHFFLMHFKIYSANFGYPYVFLF